VSSDAKKKNEKLGKGDRPEAQHLLKGVERKKKGKSSQDQEESALREGVRTVVNTCFWGQ